jgi:hypothetical protein
MVGLLNHVTWYHFDGSQRVGTERSRRDQNRRGGSEFFGTFLVAGPGHADDQRGERPSPLLQLHDFKASRL